MASTFDILVSGPFARTMRTNFYPALSALLMDVTPERRRGSAVGTFSSVFLVGNALGSMAFGYIAHGLGYGVTWSTLTVLLVAGFLASVLLRVGYFTPRAEAGS